MTLEPVLVRVAVFGTAGFALGAAHFAALRRNVTLYLGQSRRAQALGLHALRMALLAAAWIAIARFGALALVTSFGGLLAARWTVTSRVARFPEHDGASRRPTRAS
jgi:hypothetical protein